MLLPDVFLLGKEFKEKHRDEVNVRDRRGNKQHSFMNILLYLAKREELVVAINETFHGFLIFSSARGRSKDGEMHHGWD